MENSILDDKIARSVLVGNIPDDVTEQRLRKVFKEVGPVMSFALVNDQESGKRKGYGFCEYKNAESVINAMRELNKYEIHGHALTVENVRTEDAKLELRSLMQSNVQSRLGDASSFSKASEGDKKPITALPPDKMFELMKQVKHYLDNTPNDSKEMLIQHPQLSYAILRGMILMNMIDIKALEVLQLEESKPLTQPTQDTDLRNANSLLEQSVRHTISSCIDDKNTLASRDPTIQDISIESAVKTHARNAGTANSKGVKGGKSNINIPKLILPSDCDNEKAALIMQVLALTDQQVANFPPEQRQSIQALRETLASGTGTKTTK